MAKVKKSECSFPGKAKCRSETVQAPPCYSMKLVWQSSGKSAEKSQSPDLDPRGDGDTADRRLVCEFGYFRLIA